MYDGPGGPLDGFVRALDQLLTALREHLDGHVLGDEILVDQPAHEVIVGLAGRWKADFDFLEPHLHEDLKHAPLALDIHRVDERLVAITQVHRAPQRRLLEAPIGPGAVVQHNRDPRLVLLEWHLLRCHGLTRHTTYPFTEQDSSYKTCAPSADGLSGGSCLPFSALSSVSQLQFYRTLCTGEPRWCVDPTRGHVNRVITHDKQKTTHKQAR